MNELTTQQKPQRLKSLDALRGFDMFWITGGQKIIYALAVMTGLPAFTWMNGQMHHVEWNGFAAYDMIFPLFLFLAGVSMPFSFAKRIQNGDSKKSIYKHAFTRMILLVILGLIYNHFLDFDLANQRYASVLCRIGTAWFFATIIYLNSSLRWQIVWFWGLLIGYCLMMLFIPVPGFGAGVLTPEGNLAAFIDQTFLPGKLFMGTMDPEGILSTLPAISTALLGVFAGRFLKFEDIRFTPQKKALVLIGAGIVSMILGLIWDLFFPINKNLWTSSFVLYVGGLSLILLGIFYLIIDVWGFKKWAFFFIVIGMNPITIYMVQFRIIKFDVIRDFFFKGLITHSPQFVAPMLSGLGYVAAVWVFLYILYRKKIFLKV
ncbi:MAG: DUF5009 domain-containing protein [Prolixibacteraceae bacterium]|jgi:predicted acyltransferase